VDRIGSGVRVIVSIKIPAGSCPTMSYEVMIKGVLARGLTSSPAYIRRARHKHFVVVLCEQRTTDAAVSARLDACRRSSRLYFSHFATRTVDHTVDMYAAKPDIRPESRFCLPHLRLTPPLGGGGSRRTVSISFGTK